MITPSEDWLTALNLEFRTRDIDVRQRPFVAMERYCKDFNVRAITFDSQPANVIFDWFMANTKASAHHVGSMFTGVFYYDTCFWPVDILLVVGRAKIDPPASLQSMSHSMKAAMMSVPSDAWGYVLTWADCVDYVYGFDDMLKTLPANSYARSLLVNGDRELRTAGAQLLEHRPNVKSAMSCRMAVEIFLKVFLVLRADLSESQIMAFNHHLDKLLAKVSDIEPRSDLLSLEVDFKVFPEIRDRYTGGDLPSATLWHAYRIALHIAAVVARSFTARNVRSAVAPTAE